MAPTTDAHGGPPAAGTLTTATDDVPDTLARQLESLGYTQRRYYIDEFHLRRVASWPEGWRVLDLGGNRTGKRGVFNIDRYGFDVVYVNSSMAKSPDVQADAAAVPLPGASFDAVICAELLEHVADPLPVLREVHRLLRKDSIALITVPFQVAIHPDPCDYGRYTDLYWRENLGKVGFGQVEVERQGAFWSVLTDMFRDFVYQRQKDHLKLLAGWWPELLGAVTYVRRRALEWDRQPEVAEHRFLKEYTTGFGIQAIKQ